MCAEESIYNYMSVYRRRSMSSSMREGKTETKARSKTMSKACLRGSAYEGRSEVRNRGSKGGFPRN
jgi:hypothetical protein